MMAKRGSLLAGHGHQRRPTQRCHSLWIATVRGQRLLAREANAGEVAPNSAEQVLELAGAEELARTGKAEDLRRYTVLH